MLQALRTAELIPAWDASVVSVRQLEPGPPADGVTARAWRRVWGLPVSATWTLRLPDPHTVVWTRRSLRHTEQRQYAVTPEGAGARVQISGVDDEVARRELDALAGWLEEGAFAYPHGDDHSWGARLAGWLWAAEAQPDLRATPSSAVLLGVELDRAMAPCTMYCHFCPRTAVKAPRDLPSPSAAAIDRVVEGFERILDAWPADEITLWSDDVLRFPGVFRLLDAVQARGKRVTIHTPGLALGDRAFAERFVGRPVRFDLTVHAADAATTTAMCGNQSAHEAIFHALDHLDALRLPYKVAIVVTDRNVAAFGATLALLAERHGREVIGVRVFFPDSLADRQDYTDQFPPLSEVSRHLRALRGSETEVALANLPACQIDPEDLAGVRVRLTPNHNAVRLLTFAACPTCPAREVCSGVHPRYLATHEAVSPDPARVAAVLQACIVGDDAPASGAQARLTHDGASVTRLPLHPLGGAVLLVGPASGAPAWLVGGNTALRFRIDDDCPAPRREAILQALERARPALEGRAIDEVAARKLAAWVAETTSRVG